MDDVSMIGLIADDTRIFMAKINKTVSRDIVAFDNIWYDLMPWSV